MAKSKITKQKEITKETKQKVLARQNNKSVSGVYLTPYNTDFHHVIFRSDSGVGYEWNIVAITTEEHSLFHDKKKIKVYGRERYTWQEFDTLMKNHLKIKYPNWSEDKCKVNKYFSEEDYGVIIGGKI